MHLEDVHIELTGHPDGNIRLDARVRSGQHADRSVHNVRMRLGGADVDPPDRRHLAHGDS